MKQSYLLGVECKTGMLTPPNGSRTKSPRQNPPEQNPLDKIPLDKIPPLYSICNIHLPPKF